MRGKKGKVRCEAARGEDKVDYESTEHMSMLTHDNDGKSVSD